MDYLEQYFNRISPVIGKTFRNKKVAILDPSFSSLTADALARCGLKSQSMFNTKRLEIRDILVQTFGIEYVGKDSGEALIAQMINHNRFESDWNLQIPDDDDLSGFDLIVGGGDRSGCELTYSYYRRFKVPTIISFLLQNKSQRSVVIFLHPDIPDPFAFVWKNISEEDIVADVTMDDRMNWLETSDLVSNFAKAFLLRGTPYQRDDLEQLFFVDHRNVVLRGDAEWPWAVTYLEAERYSSYLAKRLSQTTYYPPLPLPLLKKSRVMLIGCGTGSLIAAELPNYFEEVCLVDYKKVSIYNPVRQLFGTDQVGKPKPEALKQILSKRSGGRVNIESIDFKLEDSPDSKRGFVEMLDSFKPDVVIIGMGRTHDINFVAAEILFRRNIRHVIPSAFPGALYFKTVVVDGNRTPCYECIQNNLSVDVGSAPELLEEARSLFYTDPLDPTQPATIVETYPSAHATLRLLLQLALPDPLRERWFSKKLNDGQNCFVGANKRERDFYGDDDNLLYGCSYPGQVVTYGVGDIAREEEVFTCPVCGRTYEVKYKLR